MLLSAAMMLDWLAVRHADAALADGARAIEPRAAAFATRRRAPARVRRQQRHRRHRARRAGAAVTAPQRIAVVGAGYFAQFHLQGWRAAGATVVAMCDTDAATARALAERFGVAACYSDAQPCSMRSHGRRWWTWCCRRRHRPRGARGAERGIPTICQKPFGTDLAPGRAIALARGPPRRRWWCTRTSASAPWFRECRRLIDAGHFGRLHGISFRLRPATARGREAYLDRQPYFQKMPQLLVRETGVHFVDTFRYLMGEVRGRHRALRRLNPVIAGEDAGS
jgi:D-apiose dehydrogenase